MHIFTMALLEMTNNSGFFGAFGAVTVFVITAAYTSVYVTIKHAVTSKKGPLPKPVIDLSSLKTHTP